MIYEAAGAAGAGWPAGSLPGAAALPPRRALALKRNFTLPRLALALALRLAFLGGRLEGAQAADLVHDALAVELVLEALERAVNGFSFADNDFWHNGSGMAMKGWMAAGSET